MADEGDSTFWKGAVAAVVFSALVIGAVLMIGASGPAAGFRKAWVSGKHLITDEYRMDEGDEVSRVAVYALATGKRVAYAHYPPQYRGLGLAADGRFWAASTASQPGLKGYTLPDLDETEITGPFASGNICFDAGKAKVREKLLDGRLQVIDLRTKAMGTDEALNCDDDGRVPNAVPAGWTTRAVASTEAVGLEQGGKPMGGGSTFLSPKPVVSCDPGLTLVLHLASLAQDAPSKLSRIADTVVWTQDVGDFGEAVTSICLEPSTLVVVGSKRIIAVDVASGAVKWRI